MYEQEKNIGFTILSLSNQLRYCSNQIAASCGQELNGMQGFIICYLHRSMKSGQPVYQKDIERLLRASRSTISGVLSGMEKRGIILRRCVSQDARLKQVLLTESAWKLQNDIFDQLSGLGQGLQNCLNQEEQDQFFRITEKLQKNLQEITQQKQKPAAK